MNLRSPDAQSTSCKSSIVERNV